MSTETRRGGGTALKVIAGLLAVGVIAAVACTFVVDEREKALVLAFGKPQKIVEEPGLEFKLPPPFNTVRKFSDRILPLETEPIEVLAVDQRRLVVDAFARWRITDPLRFYQTVNDETGAVSRLRTNLTVAIREVLGGEAFNAVLTDNRADLMNRIRDRVARIASDFGIEVVDVRIRRADLPDQNLQATYERMQTERQREAADYRARGKEAAQVKRAEADREAVEKTSEARRRSEIIRGEADAEAARILGDAFGEDPEFYAFYRSLLAYETALDGSNSTIVMSPDSDFFEYLRSEGTSSVTADRRQRARDERAARDAAAREAEEGAAANEGAEQQQ